MTALSIPSLALVAATILLAGFALLAALALAPSLRRMSLELMATLLSASVLLVILITLFLLGPLALLPALTLIAARIGFEIAKTRAPENFNFITAVSFGAAAVTFTSMTLPYMAIAYAGVWFGLLGRQILRPNAPTIFVDMLLFPILPMALLALGAVNLQLSALILATYVMVEIFDSFALFFGTLMGRAQAFPTLSPKKTIEGLAGGTLALLVATMAAAALWQLPFLGTVLTTLAVAALAVAGDLAASRHKRIAGTKDYPRVLPHQGGLLDSLDSWIAAGAGLVVLHLLLQLW